MKLFPFKNYSKINTEYTQKNQKEARKYFKFMEGVASHFRLNIQGMFPCKQ